MVSGAPSAEPVALLASRSASTPRARLMTAAGRPASLRDLDAVGAVGRARRDLVQEHERRPCIRAPASSG